VNKLISVIITAYNRKEFLLDAIESIKCQSISRNEYEILVIKNFSDELVDKELTSIGAKSVITGNCSVGEMLCTAIKNTCGEIICFLDDDDKFDPGKLEFILEKFNENSNLIYFHNSQSFFGSTDVLDSTNYSLNVYDENIIISVAEGINRAFFKKISIYRLGKLYFNLSSVSIRRYSIEKFLDHLCKISGHTDDFFFFAALSADNNAKMEISTKKLTEYRIHDSTTQFIKANSRERKISVLNDFISSTKIINDMVESDNLKVIVKFRYFSEIFDLYILTRDYRELENILKDCIIDASFLMKLFRILPFDSFFYAVGKCFYAQLKLILEHF
jgi:glycosyltransferase involved in cell wall biosynthesis